MSILSIKDLVIQCREQTILDKVNLEVKQGEWVSIVGESGSGKSVTASAIGGLLPSELVIQAGSIMLQKNDMIKLTEKQLQILRGSKLAYIFQDYQGAFTPFLTIGAQIDEMLKTHRKLSRKERKQLALDALENVMLPAERTYSSYPFQLSGGQVQRAAIAAATVLKPAFIIADEPTTALDSITAVKILELLAVLQQETNCGLLFITHDLRLVRKYSHQIAIMLKGKIVETGEVNTVFRHPQHFYTKQLFSAIPQLRETPKRLLTSNEKTASMV